MKKVLLFLMILGLGLSACKKEESSAPEETLTIKGKIYSKDVIYQAMSHGVGIPIDLLVFDQKTEKFSVKGEDVILSPEWYMDLTKL